MSGFSSKRCPFAAFATNGLREVFEERDADGNVTDGSKVIVRYVNEGGYTYGPPPREQAERKENENGV